MSELSCPYRKKKIRREASFLFHDFMHAGVTQLRHPVILTKRVLGHEVMKFNFPDSVVFCKNDEKIKYSFTSDLTPYVRYMHT